MMNTANFIRQRAIYKNWHNYQSRCQILRSQLGFNQVPSSRPQTCSGCRYYHGQSYGQSRETRHRLICGFHPYGWNQDENCPDWQTEDPLTEI